MSNKYAFSFGESSIGSNDDGKGCIKIKNIDDLSTISQPISFYYIDNKTKLQLGEGLFNPPTTNSKSLEINLETEINNNLDISGNVNIFGDTTIDSSDNCVLYVDGGTSNNSFSKNIFLQAQRAYNDNTGGNIYLYAGSGEPDGIIEISGNIIPSQSNKYDLGSSTKLFRDIYLSENSLWLGDEISLSITTNTSGEKEAGFRKRRKDTSGNFIIPNSALGYGLDLSELQNLSVSELTDFMRLNTGSSNPWDNGLFDNFNNYSFVWEKDENDNVFIINNNVGIRKSDPICALDVSGNIAADTVTLGQNTLVVRDKKIGILTDTPESDVDVSGSIHIKEDATIDGNLYLNRPIVNSYEIITDNGVMDISKTTCLIMVEDKQIDISMNNGIDGWTKHILYDDDGLCSSYANVNFEQDALVTGGGYFNRLRFEHRGQSATLVYIMNKWRIINSGASVF